MYYTDVLFNPTYIQQIFPSTCKIRHKWIRFFTRLQNESTCMLMRTFFFLQNLSTSQNINLFKSSPPSSSLDAEGGPSKPEMLKINSCDVLLFSRLIIHQQTPKRFFHLHMDRRVTYPFMESRSFLFQCFFKPNLPS